MSCKVAMMRTSSSSAATTSMTPRTRTRAQNDTVTLTNAGSGVAVTWQRGSSAPQTLSFAGTEQVQLDASAGSDAITVNDLRGSGVTDVVVNFGTTDTERTETRIVDPPQFINGVAIASEDVIARTSVPDLSADTLRIVGSSTDDEFFSPPQMANR